MHVGSFVLQKKLITKVKRYQPIWTLSGPMSNTPTMRAMKFLMVLKFIRPILHDPSTSSTISALADVRHWKSEMEEQSGKVEFGEGLWLRTNMLIIRW